MGGRAELRNSGRVNLTFFGFIVVAGAAVGAFAAFIVRECFLLGETAASWVFFRERWGRIYRRKGKRKVTEGLLINLRRGY